MAFETVGRGAKVHDDRVSYFPQKVPLDPGRKRVGGRRVEPPPARLSGTGKCDGEGLWALGGVIGVILVLWYIVLRMLNEPRIVLHARTANGASPTPLQPLSTLAIKPQSKTKA